MEVSEATKQAMERYLAGEAKDADRRLLDEWYQDAQAGEAIIESGIPDFREELRVRSQVQINKRLDAVEGVKSSSARTVPFLKSGWVRYAAAILLLLGAGGYLWWTNAGEMNKPVQTAGATTPDRDVAPGSNKAILTLADGSTIVLDSASDGNLASQGNTQIFKLASGQLAYKAGETAKKADNTPTGTIQHYNTISTPRGGQYQVQLPDGSNVWLNAASSIRFPTAFTGDERRVEITGEVYFEVAPDTRRVFYVSTPAQEVEVLGTNFNINAYNDEKLVKTTLLEGSVRVQSKAGSVLLKPSQQSTLSPSGLDLAGTVDLEDVMAWKNGFFSFQGAGIEQIMRQLARWYNVDVHYEGAIPQRSFVGKIGRNYQLSDVLNVLQASDVHFSIVNKTIIIKK